ncbi:uncharacterized protein RAG0_00336 [Rhynchosporium agropyri]|uniref:Uncharacterized protein n=1 Tax=Rhynchosporium agropyri TaxID=914238 RepID=A0A1E1JSM5_9HELO|nr:uncharacterized protein RAG0_00336 [Rhynchosporium agropyri]
MSCRAWKRYFAQTPSEKEVELRPREAVCFSDVYYLPSHIRIKIPKDANIEQPRINHMVMGQSGSTLDNLIKPTWENLSGRDVSDEEASVEEAPYEDTPPTYRASKDGIGESGCSKGYLDSILVQR